MPAQKRQPRRSWMRRGARTSDLGPVRRGMRRARHHLDWPLRYLTARSRVLPDFIVIGAMKAGTTSLYDHLVRHPDVVRARKKETRFFDPPPDRSLRWYRAHFPTTGELHRDGRTRITGEATPSYLLYPHAPRLVASTVPDARFVVILRDPIERAYSHFRHSRRLGHEPLDDFAEAVAREPERLAGEWDRMVADPGYLSLEYRWHGYLARGEYAGQLARWYEHVPRQQVVVVTMEAMAADPGAVVDEVLAFLGVDPVGHPHDRFPRRNIGAPGAPLPAELRDRLRAHYAPHDAALRELLGRELPWFEPAQR